MPLFMGLFSLTPSANSSATLVKMADTAPLTLPSSIFLRLMFSESKLGGGFLVSIELQCNLSRDCFMSFLFGMSSCSGCEWKILAWIKSYQVFSVEDQNELQSTDNSSSPPQHKPDFHATCLSVHPPPTSSSTEMMLRWSLIFSTTLCYWLQLPNILHQDRVVGSFPSLKRCDMNPDSHHRSHGYSKRILLVQVLSCVEWFLCSFLSAYVIDCLSYWAFRFTATWPSIPRRTGKSRPPFLFEARFYGRMHWIRQASQGMTQVQHPNRQVLTMDSSLDC